MHTGQTTPLHSTARLVYAYARPSRKLLIPKVSPSSRCVVSQVAVSFFAFLPPTMVTASSGELSTPPSADARLKSLVSSSLIARHRKRESAHRRRRDLGWARTDLFLFWATQKRARDVLANDAERDARRRAIRGFRIESWPRLLARAALLH